MILRIKKFIFVLFGVFLLFPSISYAQNNEQYFQNRINQLEKQIQTLSRAVYRGEMTKTPNNNYQNLDNSSFNSNLANIEIRLSDIEKQLRISTGQMERLQYENSILKERLELLEKKLNSLNSNPQQTNREIKTATTLYAMPKDTAPTNIVATNKINEQPNMLGTIKIPAKSLKPVDTNIDTNIQNNDKEIIKDNPIKKYEHAYSLIRDRKFKEAAKEFQEFLDKYPNNKLAANSQYWLAETFYVRENFKEAARMFAKGYDKYPKSPKTADNLLKLGLSLAKLGNIKDACLSFTQLEKEFPNKTGIVMQRAEKEKSRLKCNEI